MRRLSFRILVFSIVFAVFVLSPPFLKQEFGPYPLMRIGDVVDLLTPLLLIPLYWLLFKTDDNRTLSSARTLFFMLFASIWVLGQGMHLGANSIGHLVEGMEGTDIYRLTGFYDEILSHYLWHFGVFALSGLLMFNRWHDYTPEKSVNWMVFPAGLIYGFTVFAMVIEGGTFPMGLPLTALGVITGIFWGRKHLKQQPVLLCFLIGYSVAVVLFAVWGIWQGGFPEFSETGFL